MTESHMVEVNYSEQADSNKNSIRHQTESIHVSMGPHMAGISAPPVS